MIATSLVETSLYQAQYFHNMRYRFDQFNVEIENPTVEVLSVSDRITDKTCSVDIVLTTDTAQFGINLTGFTYADTWEDADVESWVSTELEKYAV